MQPFRPLAATQSAVLDGIAASTINLNYTHGTTAVRLCNIGTQTVFVRPREADDVTVTTVLNGIPIPAGQTAIFTLSRGVTNLSLFASAAGSTLYSTVGEGL
jgi:hypothetical protein